jgi:transglutaminase-like putative cysteine protease
MIRRVISRMTLRATGPARAGLAIAVSRHYEPVGERLSVTQSGRELELREVGDLHGGRLHQVDLAEGDVEISYAAEIGAGAPDEAIALDAWRYLRPSRYCESDALTPVARAEFADAGADPRALLDAVTAWVGSHLDYVPGSSLPTDGATQTLLAREGVCRDYAHLVVALLRALDVPARVAGVYAPGLAPMDFHAVAEALVDGAWLAADATGLAPRASLVRIATGRDAADTAFLTTHGADVDLVELEVTATADELPTDDPAQAVRIA